MKVLAFNTWRRRTGHPGIEQYRKRFQRLMHHLCWNVIPTVLILGLMIWATLAAAKYIWEHQNHQPVAVTAPR